MIFDELVDLFPSSYIHIGGDECYKGFWAKCPDCRARMSSKQLQNVEELQSYFVKECPLICRVKENTSSVGMRFLKEDWPRMPLLCRGEA